MSKIDDLIAAEGAAAETAQLPEDVKGERRNLGRDLVDLILEDLDFLPDTAWVAGVAGCLES